MIVKTVFAIVSFIPLERARSFVQVHSHLLCIDFERESKKKTHTCRSFASNWLIQRFINLIDTLFCSSFFLFATILVHFDDSVTITCTHKTLEEEKNVVSLLLRLHRCPWNCKPNRNYSVGLDLPFSSTTNKIVCEPPFLAYDGCDCGKHVV